MSDVKKVLIVGAGMGGLSLAIMLRRNGVAVELAELNLELGALGAGLTLNGASLRAFQRVGVLGEMMREAHIHGGRRSLDLAGNTVANTPAYTPEPGDLRAGGGILRPVLHKILSDAALAAGAEVRVGLTVSTLDQRGDGVDVTFSDGSRGRFDLVVGADGLRSRVRELIFPDAPQPKFTGQGCWRAVFKRPPEVDTAWGITDRFHRAGLNPVSKDEMYMYMLETATGNPWHEPKDWPALLEERLAPYGGLFAKLRTQLGDNARINYRPLEGLLLPPPWHKGRVVLLGDAAHATTPHAGYGAGLAVEDAIVLADCLAEDGPVDALLTRYAEQRYPRCKGVLEGSLRLGELQMANAPAEEQLAAAEALGNFVRAI